MKLHYFQHVPFEDLGLIADWAHEKAIGVSRTAFFDCRYDIPHVADYDALVVMGGPMSVHDTDKYAWLHDEKTAIRAAIDAAKPVLGICLGAQLIADCLGAEVKPHTQKEIGWFPIEITPDGAAMAMFSEMRKLPKVLHWHGDTFAIPGGATRIAHSAACLNQGYITRDNVVGLQFHIEMTEPGLERLIAACGDELVNAPWIQPADAMLAEARWSHTRAAVNSLMDKWIGA